MGKYAQDQLAFRFLFLTFPGILQGLLSILVLPLVMLILTPQDYGLYGLVIAFTSIMSTLSSVGCSFILSNRFNTKDTEQSRVLVSTLHLTIFLTSTLVAVVSLVAFFLLRSRLEVLAPVTVPILLFALFDMIATSSWGLANTVSILSRRVRLFSLFMSLRAVSVPGMVLIALFVLHIEGPLALFTGALAGGLTYSIGTFLIVRPYFRPKFDLQLIRHILKSGSVLGVGNVVDTIMRLVERSLLASYVNLTATGLWTHAQLYPNMVLMAVRPATQAAWPKLCEEAAEEPATFPLGRHLSRMISLGLGTIAMVLALVGPEMISLLTNDQFTESAPYAALLTAVAAVRFGGRPQHAIITVYGKARSASLITTLSAAGSIALMAICIPVWGLNGAMIGTAFYGVLYLTLLYGFSRKIKHSPNFDQLGLAAIVLTLMLLILCQSFDFSFLQRLLFAVLIATTSGVVMLFIVERSGLLSFLRR